MNRNIISAAVILILIITIAIAHSLQSKGYVDSQLDQLMTAAKDERWDEASNIVKSLKTEWLKRKDWISLNNSTSNMFDFERILSRTETMISTQSKDTPAQIAELREIWINFGQ